MKITFAAALFVSLSAQAAAQTGDIFSDGPNPFSMPDEFEKAKIFHDRTLRLWYRTHQAKSHPFHGATIVAAGSDKWVLKVGDLITEYDGQDVSNAADLFAAIRFSTPGKRIAVVVWRDGARRALKLTSPRRVRERNGAPVYTSATIDAGQVKKKYPWHTRAGLQRASLRESELTFVSAQKALLTKVTILEQVEFKDYAGKHEELSALTRELHPVARQLIEDHKRLVAAGEVWRDEHAKSVGVFKKAAEERRGMAENASPAFRKMYLQQAQILEKLAAHSASVSLQHRDSLDELSGLRDYIIESEAFLAAMGPFLDILPDTSRSEQSILDDLEHYVHGFERLRHVLDSLHKDIVVDNDDRAI